MTALTLLAESTRGGDPSGLGGVTIIIGILVLVVLVAGLAAFLLGRRPGKHRTDTRPNPES
jgi:hypothetical protein